MALKRTNSSLPSAVGQGFICRSVRPKAETVVACFPHAGGSAAFFGGWGAKLRADIELRAANYPGRMDRIAEPMPTSMRLLVHALADTLMSEADRRLVLFGHSLGALVAYEVARHLQSSHGVQAAHLVVSGRRAPSDRPGGNVHQMEDDQLIEEIVRLGGTDPGLFDQGEARSVFLPTVRSDFRLAETYRHEPGPELRCPLTVLYGTEDSEVDEQSAKGWVDHTSADAVVTALPGGHFYLLQQERVVLDALIDASVPTEASS